MSSSVHTPSPSLCNPRTLSTCVFHTMFQCHVSGVREKGKSCAILQHAVHIHAYRACDARCTAGFGAPLITHFGLVGGPWCCAAWRYSHLNGKATCCCEVRWRKLRVTFGEGRGEAGSGLRKLSICRCCRCTVSPSPCARQFGSKLLTRVRLALIHYVQRRVYPILLKLVAMIDFGTECLLWYGDTRALGGASRSLRQTLSPQLRQIRAEIQEIIDESNWRYSQEFEEAQRQHQLGPNW